MCFSIPLKVTKVDGFEATVEGGRIARFDNRLPIQKGDFVHLTGNIIVGKMSKENGLKIRKLIKSLNS